MEGMAATVSVLAGLLGAALIGMALMAYLCHLVTGRLRASTEESLRRKDDAQARLREMAAARDELRVTLEEKVRERTRELQKAYEELKELDSMKDDFLSSVSHELRTPLSSICAFTELLLSYDEDPATRREFLGIMKQESDRLTRLVNELLDLAKMEHGEMSCQLQPVRFPAICERVISGVSVLANGKGQTLSARIRPDLPEVLADPDRLIQVLTNLVSNAIKFTGEGGTIRITAEVMKCATGEAAREMARVAVEDSGIGIPAEEIGNVFKKFRQVGDTMTSKPTGTGLGLPISRELVARFGGTLWVESEPGKGSRFLFTLPLAVDQKAESQAPAVSRSGRERAAARAILLGGAASDRSRLRRILERGTLTVWDGDPASDIVDSCLRFHPDVAIVMEDAGSGGRVLARLKEDPRTARIPIVISPASPEASLVGEALAAVESRKKWVAVADDDAGIVTVLGETLASMGYGVLCATDGNEALELIRSRRVDVLILDLHMPRKSGWKVLEELRSDESTRTLPVIVLTGMQVERDRTRALALGAVEYLEKGKGLKRLTSEIELLLQPHQVAGI